MTTVCKWIGFYLCMRESTANDNQAITDPQKCDIVVTWKDNSKRMSGGLAFDVILKPASLESAPPLLREYASTKELSHELIEKKLREAEERRASLEMQRLTAILKDKERVQEANIRLQELNQSFSREVEKKLVEKMEISQENKDLHIKALQERLKDHALHVEEVRRTGDQHRWELKEKIEKKLESAGEKRDAQISSVQERIRQHQKHIEEVIESSNRFSKDTEEKIIQKMELSVKNREEHLSNLMERLREHDRRVCEVRKQKLSQFFSSSEESSSEECDSPDDEDNPLPCESVTN